MIVSLAMQKLQLPIMCSGKIANRKFKAHGTEMAFSFGTMHSIAIISNQLGIDQIRGMELILLRIA